MGINNLIAGLWFDRHLRAQYEDEIFDPVWDETAKLIIMNWEVEDDEDILLDDALELAMDCNEYRMIAKEHDDGLGLSMKPWDVEVR